MVKINDLKESDVSFSSGRPVFRAVTEDGWVHHLIMELDSLEYLVCREDGTQAKSWQIVP